MNSGVDTKLRPHARRITNHTTASINLYHTIIDDALREIFVRRPDTNLLNSTVLRREMSSGRERIVGFELDHGPNRHAHRDKRFFEWNKLRSQRTFDAGAGFVTRPELVAKRLDDVVRRDTDVRGAVFEQLGHRAQHAGNCAERRISLLETTDSVEMTEQFVCTVDKVNDHVRQMLAFSHPADLKKFSVECRYRCRSFD